jgi:hypothetical protein
LELVEPLELEAADLIISLALQVLIQSSLQSHQRAVVVVLLEETLQEATF